MKIFKGLILFYLLIGVGCSSKYITKSDEYTNLKKRFEAVNNNNQNCRKTTTDLKRKIKSLENEIVNLRDSLKNKTNLVVQKPQTSSNNNLATIKKYKGTETNHVQDFNKNIAYKVNYKNISFYTYKVTDPSQIQLFWKNNKGQLYKNLQGLSVEMKKRNTFLSFGMNAGIFKPNKQPEGLFIQNGKEIVKLNTKSGKGNFYLQPNGVFFIEESGKASVMATKEFQSKRKNFNIANATQSGPMLVINGKIHQKFVEKSTNLNIRNGVGVDEQGNVIFLLTSKPVNLYTFASIFKDHFNCQNALYLDGAISTAYIPGLNKYGLNGDFGPLIGISENKN